MGIEASHTLVALRRNNAAWLLLASRNAPLTLACLRELIERHPDGMAFDDAIEQLAEVFSRYANDAEFDTGADDQPLAAARREIRQWIKRGLVVERDGYVLATAPLQRALEFIDGLEQRAMTTTASRLATVQRTVEELSARLSTSQSSRAEHLRERIAELQRQLDGVERGEFEVLVGPPAIEGIREVHQLAVTLKADFRRVEDSYREADLALRHKIISEKRHRGEIVDELLAGHEALVSTPEGQVFEGFHQQLVDPVELERMKIRLRDILADSNTSQALTRKQQRELRELVSQLVEESERVIQARARGERDVKGFLASGMADEQRRVGAVLHEVFKAALDVDWSKRAVRREAAPLPPVAIATGAIPVIDRLLAKEISTTADASLDFSSNEANLAEMDPEFWTAYHALDREALFASTLALLQQRAEPLTLKALAEALPPAQVPEALTYWLAMARQTGSAINDAYEQMDLLDQELGWMRLHLPQVELHHQLIEQLDQDELE